MRSDRVFDALQTLRNRYMLCQLASKATRKFHATLSENVQEPSPNLLALSRMRLQEALETTRQGGLWHRMILEPAAWLRQIRMAPALAAVISSSS